MNTPNPRTSVVLGAALLAIVSLVALQQVSALRGQVAQTFNRLEQGESVTLPADTNNIVTCAADGNFAITDDATSAAVRFWMYEYTGNETPTYTDGAYFLSAKEKEANPNDAPLSTLTEWTAGKTYYVMTEEDVAFTCGEGIRMQQSTANIFLTGGYSVYSGTGFKLPLVGGESNLIMPLIIESTGGRVDILQLQFDVQGGTGSLELIAPNTVSLGGDVIVNNTLTATKDKCPEGSPPTLYCTSFGTTDSLMDIEQLTINFNAFMKTDVEGAVSGEVISVRLSNVIAQDNEGKLLRMNNGNATMEGEIFFGRTAADGAGANADVQVEGTVVLTSPFIMPPFTPEYGDARDWEYPLSEDPLIGPIPTGSAAIIGRIFIGNTDNTNVLNGKNKIQMKQYAFTIMHKNINIDSYAIRLKNSTITAPCETVDKKPFNEIEPDSLDIFIYEEISCSFEGLDAMVLPAEGKVYELLADISLSDTDVASYPTFLTTMNAARYFVFRQNKPAITWVDMDDERQYTHMNIINAQRTIGSEMAMFWGYVICGDGAIAGTEACDDGNTDALDGCSATCAVEEAWQCAGEPSECSVFIPTLGGGGSSSSNAFSSISSIPPSSVSSSSSSPVSSPACSDGIDNDMDGGIDYVPSDCSMQQINFEAGALCPGIGQVCSQFSSMILNLDNTAPVALTYEIYTEEYEEIYCAPQRVNVYVDGVKRATTAFIGRIPDPVTNTSDLVLSSTVTLGTIGAGQHSVRLQGESMVGGCNTGDLIGWGGHFTLDIGCGTGDQQCSSALDTTE